MGVNDALGPARFARCCPKSKNDVAVAFACSRRRSAALRRRYDDFARRRYGRSYDRPRPLGLYDGRGTARLDARHEVECLTLHGRAFSIFNAYVQPGAKLLILTDDGSTPAKIADALCVMGYGESRITVFERMDGASEGIVQSTAADWRDTKTDDFNTVAVECIAGGREFASRTPGLPDELFANDRQLTKREVRAITLAALRPTPGEMLWDVGAGCGSVAIEWMRMHPRNEAVAIERNPDRVQMIAANAEALGTPRLQIITGTAPTAFAENVCPDAIFIGGGLSDEGLIRIHGPRYARAADWSQTSSRLKANAG